MNWIIYISIFLISIYLWNNYQKRKQLKKLLTQNDSNWGKRKQNTEFDFDKIERYKRNLVSTKDVFHTISTKQI